MQDLITKYDKHSDCNITTLYGYGSLVRTNSCYIPVELVYIVMRHRERLLSIYTETDIDYIQRVLEKDFYEIYDSTDKSLLYHVAWYFASGNDTLRHYYQEKTKLDYKVIGNVLIIDDKYIKLDMLNNYEVTEYGIATFDDYAYIGITKVGFLIIDLKTWLVGTVINDEVQIFGMNKVTSDFKKKLILN